MKAGLLSYEEPGENRKEIMNAFAGETRFGGTRRRRSVATVRGATFVS